MLEKTYEMLGCKGDTENLAHNGHPRFIPLYMSRFSTRKSHVLLRIGSHDPEV